MGKMSPQNMTFPPDHKETAAQPALFYLPGLDPDQL